ncbi:MAG: thiol:disulfide interchange protein DsbA/DsbL [Gammaproteobacteria bacterium]|nr:MAG: thiol:disulfide interchange protein DsbA/DsbL [Gammaproteobacteria bacterium]RKZ97651.1 MAG: thiol:disulfide interchange protein DsbA/DsbL [Gammaproteobacteria bacterium]RLA01491.1 MAG: thiol:disulfide interchange protein DsbA/DsbL [Gammaproteobacteria bacterium]
MKKMIKAALIWTTLLLPIVAIAMPLAYVEGVHYKPTAKRLATSDKNVVEVIEMFSYSCPHCFRFEPQVMEWKKTLPENVKFVQVPAIFRDSWLQLAKVFYTAEKTGDLEKLQPIIFNAIHVEKRRLQTEDQLLNFVAEQGIDRDMFAQEMKSMSVSRKVKEALLLSQTSGISGVPSMIVNGKYIVDGPMAGSMEDVLKVVNFLIEQELN